MFRPFHSLLVKIRDLLRVLSEDELHAVEMALASGDVACSTTSESGSGESGSDAPLTMSDFRCRPSAAPIAAVLDAPITALGTVGSAGPLIRFNKPVKAAM